MEHQVLSLTGQEIICRGDKSINKHWLIFVEMEVLAKLILFRNGWGNGTGNGKALRRQAQNESVPLDRILFPPNC